MHKEKSKDPQPCEERKKYVNHFFILGVVKSQEHIQNATMFSVNKDHLR